MPKFAKIDKLNWKVLFSLQNKGNLEKENHASTNEWKSQRQLNENQASDRYLNEIIELSSSDSFQWWKNKTR